MEGFAGNPAVSWKPVAFLPRLKGVWLLLVIRCNILVSQTFFQITNKKAGSPDLPGADLFLEVQASRPRPRRVRSSFTLAT